MPPTNEKRGVSKSTVMGVLVLTLLLGGGAYLAWTNASAKSIYPPYIPGLASALKTVEVSRTPAEQEMGLSGRAVIPDDYGMLFIFDQPGRYGFWMKDMLAPIDIVWLSDEGTVLAIEHSVSPKTYPGIFYPPEPVHFVLETRAGLARERGWKAGMYLPLGAGQ